MLLRHRCTQVPCAVIGPRASESALAGRGVIDTGVAGIHEAARRCAWTTCRCGCGRRSQAASIRAEVVRALRERVAAMSQLRIAGGTVYDPANGVDGEVRDVCIDDGRIVADVAARRATASTRAAWLSCPAASTSIRTSPAAASTWRAACSLRSTTSDPVARRPGMDLARSGTGGTVPSTFTTGYRYAGLGYTTVFDAAVAPISARLSHAEFDDTPIVDGGFFVLLGNDEYLLRLIDAGEREQARDYAAWILGAAGGYAIKIVNPGGIELWKRGARASARSSTRRSARAASRRARSSKRSSMPATRSRLPHAAHIHCNNLGAPGNVATTLASMRARRGAPRALHAPAVPRYGSERRTAAGDRARASSIEYVNAHPEDERRRRPGDVRPGDDADRRRPGRVPAAQEQRAASGSTSTSSSKPAAASCRTPTRRRPPSRRCSGSSASSCSCCRPIRGASCCPPIIPTADRSWPIRSSSAC